MSLKQQVEGILKYDPVARDDDWYLCFQFLLQNGITLLPAQMKQMKQLPSLYRVIRERQKLREQYPASPEVAAYREKQGHIEREEYLEEKYE